MPENGTVLISSISTSALLAAFRIGRTARPWQAGATRTARPHGRRRSARRSTPRSLPERRPKGEALRLAEAARHERRAIRQRRSAHPRHPYLVKKQIKPHELRQAGNELLVPRFDMTTGDFVSLQRILPNGDKLNSRGRPGRRHVVRHRRARPRHDARWARGLLRARPRHEIVGHPAIVTFGCGNLMAGCHRAEEAVPAGADHRFGRTTTGRKPGNPGLTKATEAAAAVNALLAVPEFAAGPSRQGHRLQRHAPACWRRRRQGSDRERRQGETRAAEATDPARGPGS